MKSLQFKDEAAWMESRRGKITGSRLGSIFSKRDKKPLKGYYEVIAERIAIPANDENVMDRGNRLEDEAAKRFEKQTGKKVDVTLALWYRDENESIAVSPDGVISETEALEIKCLNSASHIEALLTKQIPKEYDEQVWQYFIVNDKLETLYFCFYDPRMPKDFFFFEVKRADVQEKVTEFFALEQMVLAQIEDVVNQLTF